MYEIETAIPIPPARNAPKYPLAELKVGGSFRVGTIGEARSVKTIAANLRTKVPDFRISRRKQEDGSYRIWRVA